MPIWRTDVAHRREQLDFPRQLGHEASDLDGEGKQAHSVLIRRQEVRIEQLQLQVRDEVDASVHAIENVGEEGDIGDEGKDKHRGAAERTGCGVDRDDGGIEDDDGADQRQRLQIVEIDGIVHGDPRLPQSRQTDETEEPSGVVGKVGCVLRNLKRTDEGLQGDGHDQDARAQRRL